MDKIFTKDLIIREFMIDDVSAYFKNNNEEQIKKYMPNHWHDDENKAREEIEDFISHYKNMTMPYHWAIVKANTNALIGHTGIGDSDISDSIYEIDCAICKDYRGFGYAAEATKAFVPWCKSAFGLDKIYASADIKNIASCKSLLNAGFVLCNDEFKNKKASINIYVL